MREQERLSAIAIGVQREDKLPKWAKDYVAALTESHELRSALRWTDEVIEDVPIPDRYGELVSGWLPCANRVEPACTDSVNHAIGQTDKTRSQKPRRLFSSKLLALRALRHILEKEYAAKLLDIDRQIVECEDAE